MNLCFFFLLSNVLPKVSRMKNSYCGNPTKFFLVIVMKKGPKTKWMTAIEQRQIPNIIFFTIQDITCFFQVYLKHYVILF